jgi:hypothetical protein
MAPQAQVVPTVGEVASTVILPRVAILPPLRSVVIEDLAATQIDEAQRLIAEDRGRAIATLSLQLANARKKVLEAEKIAAEQALENRQEAYWNEVYDQLFEVFREYAIKRGPESVRLLVLRNRTAELFPSRATFTGMVLKPSFREIDEKEIQELIVRMAGLDREYAAKADAILKAAADDLTKERVAIQSKWEAEKARAESDARKEAMESIGKRTTADLNLGQNRSVRVAPVGGKSIGIAGTETTIDDFVGLVPVPVTSLRERRISLEQQLEIWLKTSGYTRSFDPGGLDYTEEFDSWRKKHQFGP